MNERLHLGYRMTGAWSIVHLVITGPLVALLDCQPRQFGVRVKRSGFWDWDYGVVGLRL